MSKVDMHQQRQDQMRAQQVKEIVRELEAKTRMITLTAHQNNPARLIHAEARISGDAAMADMIEATWKAQGFIVVRKVVA